MVTLKEIFSEHRSIGEARKFLQEVATVISLLLSIGLLESRKKKRQYAAC